MKDKDNNPVRFYRVTYSRNHAGLGRITITNHIMSEWQLQQMLYDFTSRYAYIVESAVFLPDYDGESDNE